jgi:ATP-dependent Clp protease ATP-binding subunit ClpA
MAKKTDYFDKAKSEVLARAKSLSRACPTLTSNGRHLTEMYLEGKLDRVYHRDNEINAIQRILLRKGKANVLLTGLAGCGKTAIAEGLTALLTDRTVQYKAECLSIFEPFNKAYKKWARAKDKAEWDNEPFNEPEPVEPAAPKMPMLCEQYVFELSLTALTAGTKYRGDFEEKVKNVIDECKAHPEIVVFIDEIHQIVSAGRSDNSDNAAQMLKPALARRDMRVIGATTTEEARYIWSDKALARRFNEVKVKPLAGVAAKETATKILADYAAYHKVDVSAICPEELVHKTNYFLSTGVFPDSYINVVDETLASAVFEGIEAVDMSHFNATLSRMTGTIIL